MVAVIALGFAGMSNAEVMKINAAQSTLTWHGAKVMKADKTSRRHQN